MTSMTRSSLLILLTITVLQSGCTSESWKRVSFSALQQQECRLQGSPSEQGQCMRTYDKEYERYQRERDQLTQKPDQRN